MMLVWGRMIQLIQVCLFILCPRIQPIREQESLHIKLFSIQGNILREKSTTMLVVSTHVPTVKRAKFLILEKLPDATGEHYQKVDFQSRTQLAVMVKEARFTC